MSAWDIFFYLSYYDLLPSWVSSYYDVMGLLWVPAVGIAIAIAFFRFGAGSHYSMVRSLLLVTCVFLIFRLRINEQYGVYILPLVALDTAIWHPDRRRLLLLMTLVTFAWLFVNNFPLVRFLQPIYPEVGAVETSIVASVAPPGQVLGHSLKLGLGSVFTVLNVIYLVSILRTKDSAIPEAGVVQLPRAGANSIRPDACSSLPRR